VEKLQIKYEQALDLAKNNDSSSNEKFKTIWTGKITRANSKFDYFSYRLIPSYQRIRVGQGYAKGRANSAYSQ
jgi:hypothetical protein